MSNAPTTIIATVRYAGVDGISIAADHGDPDFGFHDPIYYPLTRCCHASGKGSENSPTGIVCRACYAPVPAAFGAAWVGVEALTQGLAHFQEA
jgi:hypothetical protein